jgi:sporulation protein YlmC with PRC-barrel domain
VLYGRSQFVRIERNPDMADYKFDGKELQDKNGSKIGEFVGSYIHDKQGNMVGEINGHCFRDRHGNNIAKFTGIDIQDSHGKKIATIDDIKKSIDGICGSSLALHC